MEKEAKGTGLKQLKVDNWSTFFMQRLQLLFAKGDACDITLRFHTGQELKVHSLVLRTCTTHFDTLTKVDNVINLPEVLSYTTVFPIINFMYSGKLEFKPDLQGKLLVIAKILNITILLKLLLAQKDGGGGSAGTMVRAKQVVAPSESVKTTQQIVLQQTQSPSTGLFQGKKLPFWRKRAFPIVKYSDRKPRIEVEPGPLRFTCPPDITEMTDWLAVSSPSFAPLSFETEPVMRAPVVRNDSPPPQRRVLESRLLATNDSDSDDDRFPVYSSDDDETPPPPPPATLKPCLKSPTPPSPPPTPVTLKPCLKSPAAQSTQPPAKRVRFSLGPEGKENTIAVTTPPQTPQTQLPPPPPQPSPPQPQPQQCQPTQITTNVTIPSASNHAKIIAEVLKKYPDLVKNKNIKLKISSPKQKIENGIVTDEKASYVVLRPTVRTTPPTPVTPNNSSNRQPTDQNGPFYCEHCTDIKFEQYFEYRKHLQDDHGERLEARVCEYCGYKASKRNLHLYHLFTKHNIPPPQNIKFPKCGECSYVALSDGLLQKHMNSHLSKEATKEIPREFQCDICKTPFRNQASLSAHKVTCKPGNEPRQIICDLCKMAFRTNVSLNAHLKECQGKPGSNTTIFNAEDHPVEMIEVPIIEAVNMEKGDHTLVQIPSGIILADNQNVTLLPSTESEGLNNVATGIATSIGLTVALPQDQQAVILLHGNGPEYIVPEFLDSSFATGQIAYTTAQNQVIYLGSTSGNGNPQEVLHLEEIKINQSSPSTSSIQEKPVKQGTTLTPIVAVNAIGKNESLKKKSQIRQNVAINVQDNLVESRNAQLTQNSIILIDSSESVECLKPVDVEKVDETPTSTVIINVDEKREDEEPFEESEQTPCTDPLEDVPTEEVKAPEEENTLEKNEAAPEDLVEPKEEEDPLIVEIGSVESSEISSNSLSMQSETVATSNLSDSSKTDEIIISTSQDESIKAANSSANKMVVVHTQQSSSVAEQMLVDDSREDMIVDDEKDGEAMDIEENVEPKDSMDVEETDKTGDERVESLVKDWGFDDEDTEEVITDPNAKPLRPQLEHDTPDQISL